MFTQKGNGKMLIIPADKNKANKYLLRLAKFFQQKTKTTQTYPMNNRRNHFKQSIKFNPPPLDLDSRNKHLGNSQNRSSRIK